MTTISSGKPVPSPLANISVAIGIRVLSRTVHTPSPTWLSKKRTVSHRYHKESAAPHMKFAPLKNKQSTHKTRAKLCFTCSPELCKLSAAAAAACSPAPRPAGPSPWVGTWSSWSARPAASRAPHRPAEPGSRRGAAGWGWGSSQLGRKLLSVTDAPTNMCENGFP